METEKKDTTEKVTKKIAKSVEKVTKNFVEIEPDLLKVFQSAAKEEWSGDKEDDEIVKPSEILTTYKQLGTHYKDFIGGNANPFLMVGNGGVGKSVYYRKVILGVDDNAKLNEDDAEIKELVDGVVADDEDELEDESESSESNSEVEDEIEFCDKAGAHLSGNVSAVGMYEFLYHYKDKAIVIDDVLGLLTDPQVLTMLLKAAETSQNRKIRWLKQNKSLEEKGIPRSFYFTGQIGVLLNAVPRKGALNKAVKALLTRMEFIAFEPPTKEVVAYAESWCSDKEVHDWIASHVYLMATPHLRYWYKAVKWKQNGRNWKHKLVKEWAKSDPELVQLKLILLDPKLEKREDRLAAFVNATGTSRATFDRRIADIRRDCPELLEGRKGFYKSKK